MRRFRTNSIRILPLLALSFLCAPFSASATIEVVPQETLRFERPPRDIAVSSDGEWIFVLTEGGTVQVFDSEAKLADTFSVAPDVEAIETGRRPDILFLRSPRSKSIQILAIEVVRDIDTAGSPFKGPADAPVTIVVFSEFECPYCARLSPMLDDVANAFPETVRLVYKHFPLRRHRTSLPAAMAAWAAQQQGKFWEYHHLLYEKFDDLDLEYLRKSAEELELDMEKFEADMASAEAMKAVRKDIADAEAAGVRGVPAVFVNGRLLKNRSIEGFQELIEKALAEPGKPADTP